MEKTDRRKQRGDEITPSEGIPPTFPSRSVAHVFAGALRDKVPRGVNALQAAEFPPRKEHLSGIANRPHVIREQRVNIKKVHGIRHFPVDTMNAIS